MDSINALKGYNRVGENNDRASRKNTRNRLIITIFSALVLAVVIVSALSIALTLAPKHTTTEIPGAVDSIKIVCNATRYPNSCVSSLSPLATSRNKSDDPEELFKLSLQVSLNELSKLSSIPKRLVSKVNGDHGAETALRDCQSLIEEAVDQVKKSIQYVQVGREEKVMLNESKISDLRTWLSAAVTNQETCLDGLEEMNSDGLREEMKRAMKKSMEFTSNSLAIVSKIQTILEDLHVPLHRKLLGLAVRPNCD